MGTVIITCSETTSTARSVLRTRERVRRTCPTVPHTGVQIQLNLPKKRKKEEREKKVSASIGYRSPKLKEGTLKYPWWAECCAWDGESCVPKSNT